MFKIFYRTLVILATAALLGWGMVWFFNAGPGQSLLANGRDSGFAQTALVQNAQPNANFQPNFDGGGDRGGEGSLNIQSALPDILMNLGKIGLITLAVVLARKAIALLSRRLPSARAVQI